ncbi:MAG: radical SAM protein, partial [Vicinamibacterales bacterium]
MKYSVITFGCRVNQADSLAIESELCSRGAEATSADKADVVVVNTCSVTASADQGARQTIRRIARDNPSARIVATGCYASRCADEVAALPGVIRVVANAEKDAHTFVATLLNRESAVLTVADGPCGRPLAPGLMGRTAWTLRVQTGCEESCTYCIIPRTRGASRSRTTGEIREEVTRVVAAGYKEIAITGVHLGSYGRDLEPRSSLSELLMSLIGWGTWRSGGTKVPP